MAENHNVEDSVMHSIRKNGFPGKQVQLPFKPVYDACGKNGTSLANVLENLRKEGVFGIIKGNHILFMPFERLETAETKSRNSMDLSWMKSMPGAEGIKNFIKGNMFNIDPSKLAELRKVAESLSEEDKQSLYSMLAQLSPSKRK